MEGEARQCPVGMDGGPRLKRAPSRHPAWTGFGSTPAVPLPPRSGTLAGSLWLLCGCLAPRCIRGSRLCVHSHTILTLYEPGFSPAPPGAFPGRKHPFPPLQDPLRYQGFALWEFPGQEVPRGSVLGPPLSRPSLPGFLSEQVWGG